MKASPETAIRRFLKAIQPRPIFRVEASPWLYDFLLAAGARPVLEPDAMRTRPDPTPLPADASLTDFLQRVGEYGYRDLLEFRTHVTLPKSARPQTCPCNGTLTHFFESAAEQLNALHAELIGIPTEASWIPDERTLRAVSDLRRAIDKAVESGRLLDDDLSYLRQRSQELVRRLSNHDVPSELRDNPIDLSQNIDLLDRVLNDYTDADLSRVDLSDIRLEGIRWSRKTKWPRGWRRRIVRDSVREPSGFFVIRGDDPMMRGPRAQDV